MFANVRAVDDRRSSVFNNYFHVSWNKPYVFKECSILKCISIKKSKSKNPVYMKFFSYEWNHFKNLSNVTFLRVDILFQHSIVCDGYSYILTVNRFSTHILWHWVFSNLFYSSFLYLLYINSLSRCPYLYHVRRPIRHF